MYNSIIGNIIVELKSKNVILIDLNSYISSSEIEIDDRVRNKALADIARAIGEEQ